MRKRERTGATASVGAVKSAAARIKGEREEADTGKPPLGAVLSSVGSLRRGISASANSRKATGGETALSAPGATGLIGAAVRAARQADRGRTDMKGIPSGAVFSAAGSAVQGARAREAGEGKRTNAAVLSGTGAARVGTAGLSGMPGTPEVSGTGYGGAATPTPTFGADYSLLPRPAQNAAAGSGGIRWGGHRGFDLAGSRAELERSAADMAARYGRGASEPGGAAEEKGPSAREESLSEKLRTMPDTTALSGALFEGLSEDEGRGKGGTQPVYLPELPDNGLLSGLVFDDETARALLEKREVEPIKFDPHLTPMQTGPDTTALSGHLFDAADKDGQAPAAYAPMSDNTALWGRMSDEQVMRGLIGYNGSGAPEIEHSVRATPLEGSFEQRVEESRSEEETRRRYERIISDHPEARYSKSLYENYNEYYRILDVYGESPGILVLKKLDDLEKRIEAETEAAVQVMNDCLENEDLIERGHRLSSSEDFDRRVDEEISFIREELPSYEDFIARTHRNYEAENAADFTERAGEYEPQQVDFGENDIDFYFANRDRPDFLNDAEDYIPGRNRFYEMGEALGWAYMTDEEYRIYVNIRATEGVEEAHAFFDALYENELKQRRFEKNAQELSELPTAGKALYSLTSGAMSGPTGMMRFFDTLDGSDDHGFNSANEMFSAMMEGASEGERALMDLCYSVGDMSTQSALSGSLGVFGRAGRAATSALNFMETFGDLAGSGKSTGEAFAGALAGAVSEQVISWGIEALGSKGAALLTNGEFEGGMSELLSQKMSGCADTPRGRAFLYTATQLLTSGFGEAAEEMVGYTLECVVEGLQNGGEFSFDPEELCKRGLKAFVVSTVTNAPETVEGYRELTQSLTRGMSERETQEFWVQQSVAELAGAYDAVARRLKEAGVDPEIVDRMMREVMRETVVAATEARIRAEGGADPDGQAPNYDGRGADGDGRGDSRTDAEDERAMLDAAYRESRERRNGRTDVEAVSDGDADLYDADRTVDGRSRTDTGEEWAMLEAAYRESRERRNGRTDAEAVSDGDADLYDADRTVDGRSRTDTGEEWAMLEAAYQESQKRLEAERNMKDMKAFEEAFNKEFGITGGESGTESESGRAEATDSERDDAADFEAGLKEVIGTDEKSKPSDEAEIDGLAKELSGGTAEREGREEAAEQAESEGKIADFSLEKYGEKKKSDPDFTDCGIRIEDGVLIMEGDRTLVVGKIRDIKKYREKHREEFADYQAHHIVQYPMFKKKIESRGEGIGILVEGNASSDEGTHQTFHEFNETFLLPYRNSNTLPTVEEYSGAVYNAFIEVGYSDIQTDVAIGLARMQLESYGISGATKIERMPRAVRFKGQKVK